MTVRRDAEDGVLAQERLHTLERFLARGAIGDDLGQNRVVVGSNVLVQGNTAIDPSSWAVGLAQHVDTSGGRQESLRRVFGVEPTLDGMTALLHVLLREC